MRQILFRGKSKSINKGEWIYGSFVEDTDLNACCIRNKSLVYELVDKETVGQYTGLTDKNGKMIFEGDIVKVTYTEKRQYQGVAYDDKHSCVEEIFYSEESACFMLKIKLRDISMYRPLHNFENLAMIESIEVIGNVHDNPELMMEVEE